MKAKKKREKLAARQKAWEEMVKRNRLDPRAFKKPGSVQK